MAKTTLLRFLTESGSGSRRAMADAIRGRRKMLDWLNPEYIGQGLVPARGHDLFPVGRLDKDSTGLILLTNDGELTYRLTHPRYEHEKEYLAAIEGMLDPQDRQRLETGIELADGLTAPARIRAVRAIPPFNYRITIHEGRNRQVRRMFEFLGYRVLALKRVRVGTIELGDLKEGEIRSLSSAEIRSLLVPLSSPGRRSNRCPQGKRRV